MTAASARRQTTTRNHKWAKPKLRVLNQQAIRQRARRRNALLMLFITVLLGFFVVAFVHAQLVAGQQDLDVLRADIAMADAHRAQLARSVEEASSPGAIVARASELGMVRAVDPVYLNPTAPVSDGIVPVVIGGDGEVAPVQPLDALDTAPIDSAAPARSEAAAPAGELALTPVDGSTETAPAAEVTGEAAAEVTDEPTPGEPTGSALAGTAVSVGAAPSQAEPAAPSAPDADGGSLAGAGAANGTASSIAGSRAATGTAGGIGTG